jgi:hypothetical protein
MIIPEVWSRMDPHERDVKYLIEHDYLEPCQDFVHNGKNVLASRLGYRITQQFVSAFFGRVFDNPNGLFTDDLLRPELQDMVSFVDGIDNIVGTQKKIAEHYFADNSIEMACPPLRALLHIMKDGSFDGATASDPAFRAMFTAESIIKSDWYTKRLQTQAKVDENLWRKHHQYLTGMIDSTGYVDDVSRSNIAAKIKTCERMLAKITGAGYVKSLTGFIGADPAVLP